MKSQVDQTILPKRSINPIIPLQVMNLEKLKKRNPSFRLLPFRNENLNKEEIKNLKRAFKSSNSKKIKKITLYFYEPWTKKPILDTS